MSSKTKNEICLKLWQFYKGTKAEGLDVDPLKTSFALELLLGYRTECKIAIEGAADDRFTLNSIESMILASKKFLITKQRLNFRDERTPDQLLRSMVGSMILETGISEDNKSIWAKKTDGETEFVITAENPIAQFRKDMVVWIAEPFILPDEGDGKPWSEMTKTEREDATRAALVRGASSMPKYMQKRRAKIESVTVNGDDVNAWLQIKLVEAPAFDREAFEEEQVLLELGISAAEADEEETIIAEAKADFTDSEVGVDVSKIGEGHYEAANEAEQPMAIAPPDTEANPAEPEEEQF